MTHLQSLGAAHFPSVHHQLRSGKHGDIVNLLLERGAKLEARDRDNFTALHLGVVYGHSMIVSILVDAGADVNAIGNFGHTPLHKVCSSWERKARMRSEKMP